MFVQPEKPQKLPYVFKLEASSHDARDYSYKQEQTEVRPMVSLRQFDSPVDDQQQLGSCSANATASAYENLVNQKYPDFFVVLSRLYQYYHSRYIENTVYEDAGIYSLRSDMKSLKKYCICTEALWPFNTLKFDMQPTPPAYADSPQRTIVGYGKLNNTPEIVQAINDNHPVVIGMTVFDSFSTLDATNYTVAIPSEDEMPSGGHAICLVGYSIPENKFLAKNSFGPDWGDGGYCWIPFEYADKYFFDRWVFDINNQQITYVV